MTSTVTIQKPWKFCLVETSAGGHKGYSRGYQNLAIMLCDVDHYPSQVRNTKKQEIMDVYYNIYVGDTEKSWGYRIKVAMQKQIQRLNEEVEL